MIGHFIKEQEQNFWGAAKNTNKYTFSLLPVVLFLHLDCFGVRYKGLEISAFVTHCTV